MPPGRTPLKNRRASSKHRERLDCPVDDECDHQSLGIPADAHDAAEVDLEHHGIDHEPDEDSHRDRDVVDVHTTQSSNDAREQPTEKDPTDHAQRHPQTQVLLEDAQTSLPFHFDLR